jgi:catechol 2,3-dioxygenase-like lactoylglutathione lyase family enzyme
MSITIHASALAHDDPDASMAFYRDVLGFEVRNDVGQGKMRWITEQPSLIAGQDGPTDRADRPFNTAATTLPNSPSSRIKPNGTLLRSVHFVRRLAVTARGEIGRVSI